MNHENSIIGLLKEILDITNFPELMKYSQEQTKTYNDTINHIIGILEEILV